ncbi:MAG: hypothetical protein ACE5FJ_06780, partial [Gemmatimonadales bacterium]
SPTFAPGMRHIVFESNRITDNNNHTNYDVHPDGDRFVFLRQTEQTSTALIVALNWDEELRAALGGD